MPFSSKRILLFTLFISSVLFTYTSAAQTLLRKMSYVQKLNDGIKMGNSYYFDGSDSTGYYQLWKTDGTTSGTVPLYTSNNGFLVSHNYDRSYNTANGLVYFAASTYDDGKELWRTDGTPAGTYMINLRPGTATPFQADDAFTLEFESYAINNVLIFMANDGVHGSEIWRTDGTAEGTYMLKDIKPGILSSIYLFRDNSIQIGNLVYFIALDGSGSSNLYRTDGTTEGTYRLVTGWAGSLTDGFGTLYFSRNTANTPSQVWKSDGTIAGTVPIMTRETQPFYHASSNLMFFLGWAPTTQNSHVALFKTDGTEGGTELLIDNLWGVNGMNIINGMLFFYTLGESGNAADKLTLWHSDGTTGGTGIYKEHITKFNSPGIWDQLFKVNDRIIYAFSTPDMGLQSWITDGTTAGTQALRNYGPSAPSNEPFWARQVGYRKNKYILYGIDGLDNGFTSNEIWQSDGTTAGTTQLTQFKEKFDPEFLVGEMALFNDNILAWQAYGTKKLFVYADPALNAPQINAQLCKEATYAINNQVKGSFDNSNIFSVQLSDAAGSFGAPVTIGSVNSTSSGNISVSIPQNTAVGTHYRIRIVSTSPALISVNNGLDISISTGAVAPAISTSSPYYLCPPQSKTIVSSACAGTINWSNSSTGNTLVVSPVINTTYYATCTQNGCVSSQSNSITINVANSMYTLKAGNWNDATVWSCGVIPTATRDAVIKAGHKIILSNAMGVQQSKGLTVEIGAIFQNEGNYFLAKP